MPHPHPKEFEHAYELYRQRPTPENAHVLRVYVGQWLTTREIGGIGPSLAILEVMNERGQIPRRWTGRLAAKFFPGFVRRLFKPNRPGWNDYWMCRWELTQDRTCLVEIHRRTAHLERFHGPLDEDWAMVQFTARWMANSQCQQRADFQAALLEVEKSCGMCKAGG